VKLSTEDAELFFELMLALQYDINQKLTIIPNVKSLEEYNDLSFDDKAKVRNALYDNPHLIQEFVEKNPNQFSKEKLLIVEKWKHFVKGKFYIERYLKKNAIFIGENDKVYAVLGLHSGFDEFCEKSALPFMIETVLLPFKNVIIYDGFMSTYNIFFGSGIKSDLKEIYLTAKQNGTIMYSLDSENQKEQIMVLKPQIDQKPEVEKLLAVAKKLRGGNGQPAINSAVFSLVKASLELADKVLDSNNDVNTLYKSFEKVDRTLRKVENAIYRMD